MSRMTLIPKSAFSARSISMCLLLTAITLLSLALGSSGVLNTINIGLTQSARRSGNQPISSSSPPRPTRSQTVLSYA